MTKNRKLLQKRQNNK